eukprot:COSAG01_NODE_9946_length_2295_cov_1.247723_3_plen_84_part_00
MYTVNVYMNGDFEGGSTRFYDDDVSGGVSFAVCTPAHASDSRSVCKSRRVHVCRYDQHRVSALYFASRPVPRCGMMEKKCVLG